MLQKYGWYRAVHNAQIRCNRADKAAEQGSLQRDPSYIAKTNLRREDLGEPNLRWPTETPICASGHPHMIPVQCLACHVSCRGLDRPALFKAATAPLTASRTEDMPAAHAQQAASALFPGLQSVRHL